MGEIRAGVSAKISNINDRRAPDFAGVVDAAHQIMERRREKLLALKAARLARDVEEAFKIIDELVPDGVFNSHDKEMPSIIARFNRRPSR
jgi:hypothetical protein